MNQVLQTKVCTKCHIEKPIMEFYFRKDNKKYRNECQICFLNKCKKYYQNNFETIASSRKIYIQKNSKKIVEKVQKWKSLNPEKNTKHLQQYAMTHKNQHKQTNQIWRLHHPTYQNEWNKNQRLTNPLFKLKCNIRSRVRLIANKSTHSIEYLGQTIPAYQSYLQAQFDSNMTHANYGKVWHIDHIIPLSFFDLSDPTEQRQAFHYTNTRPLLVKDNLEKGDKILALNYNDPTPFI